MTVRATIATAAHHIARRDAEGLLGHVLEQERSWLLAHPEAEVAAAAAARFASLVARRTDFEPMQYLVGAQEFYGLCLQVTPDTLIPRPETERLVESVLAWVTGCRSLQSRLRIVDVGTGTGAIALALAANLAAAEIVAVDISAEALAVARQNADRLQLTERVRFLASDLLDALPDAGAFDVVVSNPPYVAAGDAATMQPEVVRYEPHGALFAGDDGLALYRRLIPQAAVALRPGGLLAMEFGFGQQPALTMLLQEWAAVRFVDDYAGIPRVVLAERA